MSRLPEFVERLQRGNAVFFTRDFVANILLFVPFGVIACLHFPAGRRRKWSILLIAVLASLLSFSVEFAQFFVRNRHSSITDVISNTMGAVAGALMVAFWPRSYLRGFSRLGRPHLLWPVLAATLVLAAVPAMIPIVFPDWHLPQLWARDVRLHAGNNPSLTRPWYGELQRIAIYDCGFDEERARRHLSCMRTGAPVPREAEDNLVALYEFDPPERAGLLDKGGGGLDLRLEGPGRLRWKKVRRGVYIRQPGRLSTSQLSGSRISNRLLNARNFSVEVWFAPRNLLQKGPALILNLAGEDDSTNLLLGQSSRDLVFWVRTPVSGPGLTALSATTMNQPLTRELTQVIAVFRDGRLEILVNGALSGTLDLQREPVAGIFAKRTGGSRTAFAFFYFFPFTLIWSSFLTRKKVGTLAPQYSSSLPVWLAPAFGALLFLVFAEILHARSGGREFDMALLVVGMIVIFAAAVFGRLSSPPPGGE